MAGSSPTQRGMAGRTSSRDRDGPSALVPNMRRAYLDCANAAFAVELDHEGLSGEVRVPEVGEEPPDVQVDAVPADRMEERHPCVVQQRGQVADLADAVLEVRELGRFGEADRRSPRGRGGRGRRRSGTPRRGSAASFSCSASRSSRVATNPPMLTSPSFLALIVAPVGQVEELAADLGDRPRAHPGLSFPHQEGVLGPPAHVEVDRHPMGPGDTRRPPGSSLARPVGHPPVLFVIVTITSGTSPVPLR